MKYVCSSGGEFLKKILNSVAKTPITGWSFNCEKICHQNYFSMFILVLQIFKKFCQLVIFFSTKCQCWNKIVLYKNIIAIYAP